MKKSAAIFLLGALVIIPACRVKSPTVAEQRELANRGSFGGISPAWVSKAATQGTGIKRSGPGIMPTEFAASSVVTSKSSNLDPITAKQERKAVEASAEDSPLNRIAATCPDVEVEVNQALTNTDLENRAAQYEALTAKCSSSADLWFWLAEDYYSLSSYLKAREALDKALSLNSSHAAAKALSAEVNAKLQGGSSSH